MRLFTQLVLFHVLASGLAVGARSQELLWELHSQSGVAYGGCAKAFGDFDHDGYDDLLMSARVNYMTLNEYDAVRILSGRDGSLLHEQGPLPSFSSPVWVGDFDLDGYPDYAFGYAHLIGGCIEVWSPTRDLRLLQVLHPPAGWGWGAVVRGGLDCTGDGLPDLIVSGGNATQSIVDVYDHSGALYYSIPARALGFVVQDIAGVGDLDGDGADDFIVGANELHSGVALGVVVLISGRTGVARRIHWGPQPFDILGRDLRRAGDMDGDGVMDYAGGNYGGFRGLVRVWSGATGALIREWTSASPVFLGGLFLAGHDVDLDGRPDIVDVAGGYPNSPGPNWLGRARLLSSRDGQDLVYVASQQWTSGFLDFADLGVQPGNPYPVFALMDTPNGTMWPRIRVWRGSPLGTQIVGQGCSNPATIPTIGLRRVDAVPPASTDGSRIVLGSAPPDALALCVVAPVAATSSGGISVPLLLDPLGLSGCTLLVPPVLIALRVTGSTGMDRGYAGLDLLPALVPTAGTEYAAQWVVLDPVTLAYATTARYEFRVQ